jgi:predicted DCC family thiol-disulfide oxidoreductase YuxK
MSAQHPNQVTVYFDGSCPLCTKEIGLYQNADGAERITFCDVSRADINLPADLTPAAAMARFHVRGADGRLESGAAGFALLWSSLPRWRWLGRIVSFAPVKAVAELTYRGFLKIRPAVQRWFKRSSLR